MMKTRLLMAFMLLTMTTATWAETATQQLVVWLKGGEKVYFDLAEEPETTFEEGKLVIKTSRSTIYYHLENVLRYTYQGAMTGIDSPKVRPGEIIYRQGKDQVAFDGLADGKRIDIYSMDGKLLRTMQAKGGKQTVVFLAGYPTGTYLIKIDDATYKFLKR